MAADTGEPVRRVGMDRYPADPKQGKNPIGSSLTPDERERIIAALAAANKATKLFPPK